MKPINKSRTGSKELVHNGTRKSKGPTPVSHFKAIEKSTTGSGQLAGTARTEMATSTSHFKATPHSSPEVPVKPRKWHKKGYSMQSPS